MSFFSQNKLDTARIKQRMMNETYLETPDFTETLSLSFEQGRATDQFTSDMNLRERFHEPQMEELETMRADGLITDDVWDSFSKRTHEHSLEGPVTDWQGLADYANSKYGTEFDLTDETMYATVREESHARERQLAKAGGWGVVPQFIAGMGVIATDPVQAPLMLAPGAQMRFGSTAVRTAAKMAFREGMVNVAIEAPLQLSVASFREKVGLEYGLSEGATNLAAAFVFGGAFGAVRGGYRIHTDGVKINDAIEMQGAVIKELEARGPLQPEESRILADLKLSQELFADIDPELSVTEGYNQVAWQMQQLNDSNVTAATRATAQADADLDAAAKVGDVEDDFVPEMDLETPLDTRRVTETGIVDEAVPEPRPIELPEVPVEVPLLSRYTAREMVSEKDGVGRTVHYDPANPDIQLTTGWPEDGYLGGTLEVLDDISNIGGKGSATAAYIKGLKEAADRGLGWRSEGILSDASHRMYARLGELGFDVQPHGAGYIISEDSIRKTLDGPPKAPEPRPIELPEVPVEYRDPPPAEEGPWAETVDTRGQGVQYHGTSTPLDGTDNSYYSTMNIYGQGFYTSDAGDIVRGYSKKGKGGQPTLYTVTPNRALNIYDMELPLVDTMKDILRGMNDDGFNDLLDEFPDISLRELYDERRVYDEFEPADEVQEIFTAVRDTLEDAGFDGLTHVGGKRTGKSAHNVEIYFNPKDDLNMELVEPPKAPEPRPIELPEVRTSPEWEEYTASRDIPIPQLIEYGDGVNSPYLLADGKVTGSSGDHLDAIGVYFDSTGVDVPDLNYETFQKATGSIRAMFYRQNGEYNITLQLFGDQKLTPNQVATLRAIEAGAEDPVRVSVGISEEGAGGTNPPYSAPTTLEEAIALHSAPPEPKAPETQPRTLGEAYAKMDADTEITMKDLDNYWECRNG